MSKNYPTTFGINDLADVLTNIFGEGIKVNPDWQLKDVFKDEVPYRYNEKHGIVSVEAVVAGHKPENIKVTYNESKHVLRITDNTVVTEDSPWYFNDLRLEFTLPETTDSSTFVKTIENGVLVLTVLYKEDSKTNCADIEI
jgi:HSP20 family molecular chaperone IbpA